MFRLELIFVAIYQTISQLETFHVFSVLDATINGERSTSSPRFFDWQFFIALLSARQLLTTFTIDKLTNNFICVFRNQFLNDSAPEKK